MTEKGGRKWVRGVNLGGWLLLERFITPYFFALTSCHLEGDFCFYKGQIDAPPVGHADHKYCDLFRCQPHLIETVTGETDYPVDEYTLVSSFEDKYLARRYMEYHWENFVTFDDLKELKANGVTHIRVPIPHWILGNIQEGEPWVDGGWVFFIRLVSWCRDLGIQVWPDIHTAPGSQNGFDNSGQLGAEPTCEGWGGSEANVQRSLDVVKQVAEAINRDGLHDVVTGFGILNEPFKDCDMQVVREFTNEAYKVIRDQLGTDTAVYIGDLFNATKWNDGWWLDANYYPNTYLDSHYYHVFAEEPRALSPKQHIAYVCGKNARDTNACCYEDSPHNNIPSKGITRMIGEWSASYDTLPVAKLQDVMKGIQTSGAAPEFDRQISQSRQAFLRHFVEAQMVTYEAADVGVSSAWFYWTLKMEGGAFAEWDFLRGLREGWIPPIPPMNVSSQDRFGSCHDIADKTKDDMDIINEFPDPKTLPENNWQGVQIDDDYVLSHAGIISFDTSSEVETSAGGSSPVTARPTSIAEPAELVDSVDEAQVAVAGKNGLFPLFALVFFCCAVWKVFFQQEQLNQRLQYTRVGTGETLIV